MVAKASVNITNVATGSITHTETSSSGDYTAPFLQVGTYKVTVEAPGFQKSVVDNISLVVAQQARADVTLKAGSVNEFIEVQASAVTLETDSATVAQTVTQRQVDQLPLANRNFINLIFLTAGAVMTNGEQGQMRQGAGNAISINGSRPESNNYTLDGIANVDTALGTPAVILSQDAIQEFKIQSGTYSAEYGFSANQVNIVSKSGTNQLHGTAFEFLRNDAFDALPDCRTQRRQLKTPNCGRINLALCLEVRSTSPSYTMAEIKLSSWPITRASGQSMDSSPLRFSYPRRRNSVLVRREETRTFLRLQHCQAHLRGNRCPP